MENDHKIGKHVAILYHANCNDGLCAAAIAYDHLHNDRRQPVILRAVNYGEPAPRLAEVEWILIVDFSYPRDVTDELCQVAALTVIDHHVTTINDIGGVADKRMGQFVLDKNKSGARLTWEYFHPDDDPPEIVRYVEDRDLWKWELPFSREVSAGLQALPRTVHTFIDFILEKRKIGELIGIGSSILAYQRNVLDKLLTEAEWFDLGTSPVTRCRRDAENVLPAKCVNTPILQSEVCEELLKQMDVWVAAAYWEAGGKRIWSLRSRVGSGFNCAQIAEKHGGGGHEHAAGFVEVIGV